MYKIYLWQQLTFWFVFFWIVYFLFTTTDQMNTPNSYTLNFKKDKSTEKGFWADEETWFDDKNRIKQNVYDILKQNKWVKEAKRQQKELDIAKKDIKVIQLNKSVKNSSIS